MSSSVRRASTGATAYGGCSRRAIPIVSSPREGSNGNATAWHDADADGVLDGYERWYFGDLLDEATTDTDVYGLDLLGEFAARSDPTDADTDDDGVEDGADAAPQDRLVL